jgi:serine protease
MPHLRLPFVVFAVLAIAACSDTSQPTAPASDDAAVSLQPAVVSGQEPERVMPGRILARLAPDADPSAVARSHGVAFERVTASGRVTVFRGAVGSERAAAARLRTDASVVYAEPDYLRQTTAIDPRLWAFHNPGGLEVYYTRGRNKGRAVTSLLSMEDADIDNAEGYGAGGAEVAIASIDTGVEFGHPEFGNAELVAGWDFYSNDADPSDTNDHGTHTTGTMVGDNVGVAGVAGAASRVRVYVYRVCGELGCPTSAIVGAIYAAADAGVVAMNLSLGGGSLSQSEADAIQYAVDQGALVIASAGNDGAGSVSCPACDPNAISVAATDWLDQHAYYTNYGSGLDISAPGGELYSNTTSEAGIWSAVRGGYAYFQGTSMAAPQVTGAAAVVASVRGLTGPALRAQLEGTADDLGADGYDTQFGHGRLNAYMATTGTPGGGGGDPPPDPPSDPVAASFTYSCSGDTCTFNGSGSTGNPTVYDWSFGDGGSGSGATIAHTYAIAGTYDVTLTVTAGSGSDWTTDTVNCRVRGKRLRCS